MCGCAHFCCIFLVSWKESEAMFACTVLGCSRGSVLSSALRNVSVRAPCARQCYGMFRLATTCYFWASHRPSETPDATSSWASLCACATLPMQYPETPAPVLRRATASFLALEEDELSFEAGDTVELLGESSSPGWLLGRRGQLVGLVPPGYFPDLPLARPAAFGPGSAACSSDQLNHHAASAAAAAVDADVLAAFMRFDRNGSGKLDYRELGSALATLQLDATTAQARRLLSNPMPKDSGPDAHCPMPNAQCPTKIPRLRPSHRIELPLCPTVRKPRTHARTRAPTRTAAACTGRLAPFDL